MPPEGHELFRRVRQAAAGTPYAVVETEQGFDVTLDVVDAAWHGVFSRAGLSKVHVHHVAFPKPGVYTITDDSRTLEWVAGVPHLTASLQRQRGRVVEVGAGKVWAFDEHGDVGVRAAYRFSSEEGRDLITGIAGRLPLRQARGTAEKVGIGFGIFGGVMAVAAIMLCVVVALTR